MKSINELRLLQIFSTFQDYISNRNSISTNSIHAAIRTRTSQAFPHLARQASHEDVIALLQIILEQIQQNKATVPNYVPSNIQMLEIGAFTGLTSVACSSNAFVTALEKNKDHFSLAQENISLFAQSHRVALIQCDAQQWLDRPRPATIPPFDLVYLDANKKSYARYFEMLYGFDWISSFGLIVADNMNFRGLIHDNIPTRLHPIVNEIQRFRSQLSHDQRFHTLFLDDISDGITVSIKNF